MYKVARLAFACSMLASAETSSPVGTPVEILVSIGHYYSHRPTAITRDDLIVLQEQYDRLPVTNLIPLRGDRAGFELFLLVDNCSNCEPGLRFYLQNYRKARLGG